MSLQIVLNAPRSSQVVIAYLILLINTTAINVMIDKNEIFNEWIVAMNLIKETNPTISSIKLQKNTVWWHK